jgi:hypothetical protein
MQPVEALPSLRTLALIAVRFEQMAAAGGPRLGLVLRINLDWLEGLGADEDPIAERRREIIAGVEAAGVTPAEVLHNPEDAAGPTQPKPYPVLGD